MDYFHTGDLNSVIKAIPNIITTKNQTINQTVKYKVAKTGRGFDIPTKKMVIPKELKRNVKFNRLGIKLD